MNPWDGRWLLLLIVLALQACSSLDAWQRQKIYRPTPVPSLDEWNRQLAQWPGIRSFAVPSADAGEQIVVVEAPATATATATSTQTSRVRVLFLHGTYRHALQNLIKAEPMRQLGLDVVIPDYRGWGISTARLPSEQSIHDDAWSVWQALQSQDSTDDKPVRWVIYGHSMGSAVAVRLAQRLNGASTPCALVLESAFTSFADVAEDRVGWLGRAATTLGSQRMASRDYMAQVALPVWFLHGSQDTTVPMTLGRRLFELAPEPRQWRQWPMGHSDLQRETTGGYRQTWAEIVQSCTTP